MRWFKSMFGVGLALAAGCATLSPDSTIQELLDASGLGGVTVSDVLSAIEEFTGQDASLPLGQTLTADQETEIAALQAQLNAGEITNSEYAAELLALVGAGGAGHPFNAGPGRSFGHEGFRGGPRGPGGGELGGLSDELSLTEDQQTQAQTIFDSMREDVLALQETAGAEIDALLTAEQIAQLDQLDSGKHGGFRVFGHELNTDRLSEALGLSEEQQAAIQAILDELEAVVEARRQQARDEFRAILTVEQQAILDQREAGHSTADSDDGTVDAD